MSRISPLPGYWFASVVGLRYLIFFLSQFSGAHIYIYIYVYRRVGAVSSPVCSPPNREIVSCRAHACARCGCLVTSRDKFTVSWRSLLPFGTPAFPSSARLSLDQNRMIVKRKGDQSEIEGEPSVVSHKLVNKNGSK